MHAVSEGEIRSSFINCSKGDAKRMPIPRDLDDQPWEDLDFLGWTDPQQPGRGYVVGQFGASLARPGSDAASVTGLPSDHEPTGIALRFESAASRQSQMCSICLTTHTRGGVALMSARKVGESGRRGNSIGVYMCADLACPLYVRGKKKPALGTQHREDLSVEQKIARLQDNLTGFVSKLYR